MMHSSWSAYELMRMDRLAIWFEVDLAPFGNRISQADLRVDVGK